MHARLHDDLMGPARAPTYYHSMNSVKSGGIVFTQQKTRLLHAVVTLVMLRPCPRNCHRNAYNSMNGCDQAIFLFSEHFLLLPSYLHFTIILLGIAEGDSLSMHVHNVGSKYI